MEREASQLEMSRDVRMSVTRQPSYRQAQSPGDSQSDQSQQIEMFTRLCFVYKPAALCVQLRFSQCQIDRHDCSAAVLRVADNQNIFTIILEEVEVGGRVGLSYLISSYSFC